MDNFNYLGGKAGAGVFQTIINQIPPHDIYIEGFLGGGAILRKKRPAAHSIGIDRDHELINRWKQAHPIQNCVFVAGDFLTYLEKLVIPAFNVPSRTFFYLDPPYLPETRKDPYTRYKFDMSRAEHAQLLKLLRDRPEKIMLSGYRSDLYDRALADWRTLEFNAMTRGGKTAREVLYMNYAPPVRLHDYAYLGENFTERQRIKRKAARFKQKILNLPPLERAAILAALDEISDLADPV